MPGPFTHLSLVTGPLLSEKDGWHASDEMRLGILHPLGSAPELVAREERQVYGEADVAHDESLVIEATHEDIEALG